MKDGHDLYSEIEVRKCEDNMLIRAADTICLAGLVLVIKKHPCMWWCLIERCCLTRLNVASAIITEVASSICTLVSAA